MMKIKAILSAALFLAAFAPGPSRACTVFGIVYCDVNLNGEIDAEDQALADVGVLVEQITGTPWTDTATTDENGYYQIDLPWGLDQFRMTLATGLPGDAVYVAPASGVYFFDTAVKVTLDWLISSSICQPMGCWLTGGGAKFCAVTGTYLAERGPQHSFGGNVYPGCSPDAGQGGNWNHVAHVLKLHFQGTAIQVIKCGNMADIPPGSESPDTPNNYIDFKGTGRLKGIKGNKLDLPDVYFFCHVEDRNEPGSNGAKAGALIDRYFINVFLDPDDPVGTSVFCLDVDEDPGTVDPVTITGGNLQLHISSCSQPPPI
jgi:hypothetical protein